MCFLVVKSTLFRCAFGPTAREPGAVLCGRWIQCAEASLSCNCMALPGQQEVCAPGGRCSAILLSWFPDGTSCVSLKENIFLAVYCYIKGA